jgi:hypothetical protein
MSSKKPSKTTKRTISDEDATAMMDTAHTGVPCVDELRELYYEHIRLALMSGVSQELTIAHIIEIEKGRSGYDLNVTAPGVKDLNELFDVMRAEVKPHPIFESVADTPESAIKPEEPSTEIPVVEEPKAEKKDFPYKTVLFYGSAIAVGIAICAGVYCVASSKKG